MMAEPSSGNRVAADGEEDGEGADGHYQKKCEEKVDGAHGDREGGDDEVVSHLDDAELLLYEADEETQQETHYDTHGRYHHAFYPESKPDVSALHAHAAEGGNVALLV